MGQKVNPIGIRLKINRTWDSVWFAKKQNYGTYLIEGSMMIRDINRRLDWELPTEGPKTLSGLILEEIQTIPDTNVGLAIANYRIETVSIKDNVIKLAKLQKIDIEEETDEEQE